MAQKKRVCVGYENVYVIVLRTYHMPVDVDLYFFLRCNQFRNRIGININLYVFNKVRERILYEQTLL
jgi:hypothetical protein